jgi:hypothetical protein
MERTRKPKVCAEFYTKGVEELQLDDSKGTPAGYICTYVLENGATISPHIGLRHNNNNGTPCPLASATDSPEVRSK